MHDIAQQLPPGIHAHQVQTATGLQVHYLQAGKPEHPVLLLLHGFPELAFSWRKVMLELAHAGYRVIAPDQRGYGATSGWQAEYGTDLEPYRMTSLVLDQLALQAALDISQVAAVIGHDFGSPVAAWAGLLRPDRFKRVVMMSAPFGGAPGLAQTTAQDMEAELARLQPAKKHYQSYYCTPAANQDMLHCRQGIRTFLAQYYYLKSGLWAGNQPAPLAAWEAPALASLPGYYVMPHAMTMPEVVAADCEDEPLHTLHHWLSDEALNVYATTFQKTGFQGGLNWYRAASAARHSQSLRLFSGRRISVPALFIAGSRDWGMYQTPRALERMSERICQDFRGSRVIPEAGHWVQQEQPQAVLDCVLAFLADSR